MRILGVIILLCLSSNIFCQQISNAKQNDLLLLIDSLEHLNKIDSALQIISIQISERNNIVDTNLVQLQLKQGELFERIGKYKQSARVYYDVISKANSINRSFETGKAYAALSNLNFRMGNNHQSLNHSIKAANIFQNSDNNKEFINATMLTGFVYIGMGQYLEARRIYNETLKKSYEIEDSTLIAENLNHLGVIEFYENNYSEALNYYSKSLEINLAKLNHRQMAINYANIGEVYLVMENYSGCIEKLDEALEIENKHSFSSLRIFILQILGLAWSKLDDKQKALNYYKQSLNLIDETGEDRERPYIYRILSEYYEKNGDNSKALLYHKLIDKVKDSLNIQAANFVIEESRIKFEIAKKEEELAKIKEKRNLQEKEIESNKEVIKLQTIIIILILLFLFVSMFLAFYLFRNQKKLKIANKTKDILFSVIGHDLRNSVGSINNVIEIIQDPEIDKREEFIRKLKRPVGSAYVLLENLLAWSRSIGKNTNYHPKEIFVSESVKKAIEIVENKADDKNIQIITKIPDSTEVYADPFQLDTILRNLLSNAIKFSFEGGIIEIYTEELNKRIRISIKDRGIGISKETIENLLHSTEMYTTFGTNNEKGTGLGLILCKDFIKKNKGILSIYSDGINGSVFSFTLPSKK